MSVFAAFRRGMCAKVEDGVFAQGEKQDWGSHGQEGIRYRYERRCIGWMII